MAKIWLSVSGDAGARRPHAGGCARSQLCRRSGRSHSCSRSARSCTATRAGSALGTHRCLEVRATGAGFIKGARALNPLSVPLHPPAAGLGIGPTPQSPCPAPFALLAYPRSVHEMRRAGSRLDTRTPHRPAGARSGHSRSGTHLNPLQSCPLLRQAGIMRTSTSTSTKLMVDDPRRLCPFPVVKLTSRGLPQQQGAGIPEGVALTLRCRALGPWEGQGRSVTGMHPGSRPNTPLPTAPRWCPPAPRGGQGRHWAPQPRPWRQQQSSKVRAGPVRGPAHMPSSPRWAQHTSRRSGARSMEEHQASTRGDSQLPVPTYPCGAATPGHHTVEVRALESAQDNSPSPAGLSGSWQSRPAGPGTQGGRHSQR